MGKEALWFVSVLGAGAGGKKLTSRDEDWAHEGLAPSSPCKLEVHGAQSQRKVL